MKTETLSPPAVTREAADPALEQIAFELDATHEKCLKHSRHSLDTAIDAGKLLLKAKEMVGHGKWSEWLKKNVKFSPQTARAYMRLAEHPEKTQATHKLTDALAAIAGTDTEEEPEEQPAEKPTTKPEILCARCQEQGARPGCNACKIARKIAKHQTKQAKKEAADRPVKDPFGNVVPKRLVGPLRDPWLPHARHTLEKVSSILRAARISDGLKKRHKYMPEVNLKDTTQAESQAQHMIDQLLDHLDKSKPAGVCPKCEGKRCAACSMTGLVTEGQYKKLSKGKK
jgi:hypothetical protein